MQGWMAGVVSWLLALSSAVVPESSAGVSVRFDFADGLSARVTDRAGGVALREVTSHDASLVQMPRGDDWAVHFPTFCPLAAAKCPRAILESGSADRLNPGTRPLRFGASVMMLATERSAGSNVLQKGYSTVGSQFKLQVDGDDAVPSCVVSGTIGGRNEIFIARGESTVADGLWHEIDCVRQSEQLTISIDGERGASVPVPAELLISNDHPLRIGGKSANPRNDQFHGTLDDVYVYIE